MTEYFECHITMVGNPKIIKNETEFNKWSFSKIDGDINFGEGIKCYATKQFNIKKDTLDILKELYTVSENLSKVSKIMRRKIERIIFDEKVNHA